MNNWIKGIILIVIGLSLVFPFISDLIFKNIAIILGLFLIFTGVKLFFTASCSSKKDNRHD